MIENINHYSRQLGLVNPELLALPIFVLGAGGIGSWTTYALLKLGCQNVTVMDHDSVEEHNVGSQMYTSVDAGMPKVEALKNKMDLLTDMELKTIQRLWLPNYQIDASIVISAVDSITVRKVLFNSLKGKNTVFIDGRMAGNVMEIYVIPMQMPERVVFYETTLFSEEEASPVPCTERAVIYNTFVIGGLIANIVGQLVSEKLPPREISFDLANFMLFAISEEENRG